MFKNEKQWLYNALPGRISKKNNIPKLTELKGENREKIQSIILTSVGKKSEPVCKSEPVIKVNETFN